MSPPRLFAVAALLAPSPRLTYINTIASRPLEFYVLLGHGELGGPLLGRGNRCLFVLLPALGYVGSKRVVGVGGTQEGLNGEENGSDLERGRPVVCRGRGDSLSGVRSHATVKGFMGYSLLRTSRQIRPSLSTLGWKIFVRKRILGGVMG